MIRRHIYLLIIVLLASSASVAAEAKSLAIGSPAPNFDLPGVDGRNHQLADFADAKVLVVLFTCNHCPTAQAYEERIKKLHADYKARGVAVVAISPNDPQALRLDELGYTDVSDSFADMKIRAKDQKFEFPYLYDGETQTTSREYGVLATPHVFIFDAERKLRYVGRIDDSDVKEVKSHDARNAIDALLADKPVAVEKTKIFGCSTKWSDKREDAKKSLEKWNAEPVTLESIDEAGLKIVAANDDPQALLRLISAWATYCPECVAEMPQLVEINRMYRHRNFETVTITLDDPDKKDAALAVLKANHLSARNHIFSGDDKVKLVEALDKEWEGPTPFTLLVAPGGKVLYRKTGPFDPLELKRAIVAHLGRTYASR